MILSPALRHLLQQEADWRQQTINLNASENYTSPLVKQLVGLHPSYDCYPFPPSGGNIEGVWQFSGPPYLQGIERLLNHLGQQLLECPILDARPKGGQAAEITLLVGLANAGDSLFYVQERDGGHFGLNVISQKMGIRLIPLCFDPVSQQIEVPKTIKRLQNTWNHATARKTILIGQSFILRPLALSELTTAAKNSFPDVIIGCDISHTLGLIIGQQLPNPILQGVDVIHGSTHKTLPGPQKGIIGFPATFNPSQRETIQQALSPGLQSQCGTSEILALAVTLEEMRVYGKIYAQTVCYHARYLAEQLDRCGFSVVGKTFGFTETHQIWIIIGSEQQAWQAFAKLHRAGIRAYPAVLPFVQQWGLRLGTAAVTRLGFSTTEIDRVVLWIHQVLLENIPPEQIAKQVKQLMQYFPLQQVRYTLPDRLLSQQLCAPTALECSE